MALLEIGFDEILHEIDRLSEINPDGFTVSEMCVSSGHSEEWCRKKLSLLISSGKAYFNGKARRKRIDGQPALVPVYLIKKTKDGKTT